MSHKITLYVADEDKNMRLDSYIAKKEPSLSRNYARKLIKDGNVTINGEKAKPHTAIKSGYRIQITIPATIKSHINPENIPIKIIYEDENVIVIDKPAGMVVHPSGSANLKNTLVNAILHHCKDLSGIGGVYRPGIVHRLDKDTSGVMIIAKNDHAHQWLSDAFKNRTVKKTYLALVKGHFSESEGRIEAAIGRSYKDRKKQGISQDKKARSAISLFKVIKQFQSSSLIEVYPLTGRTHQIRVHLSAIYHPILGDKLYGDQKLNKKSAHVYGGRMLLHAFKLRLTLPNQSHQHEFTSQIPEEFLNLTPPEAVDRLTYG